MLYNPELISCADSFVKGQSVGPTMPLDTKKLSYMAFQSELRIG